MAIPQKVGLRRSGVQGNIPNASQIELGELAFNTKDGKIYFKDQEDNIYDLTDKFTQQEVEQIVGGLTTNDIVEGGNLYFTQQRVRNSVSASGDLNYDEVTGEFSVTTYKTSDFDTDFSGKSSDDLLEGLINLYFTEQRARDSISVNGDLSYSNGIISFNETYSNASEIKTAYESNVNTNAFTDSEKSKLGGIESGAQVNTVTSVANKTGDVSLNTDDVDESSNLYFTQQRSRASISSSGDLSYNESSGVVSYTAPTPQEIKKGIENIPNTHFVTDIEKHRVQTDPMLIYFL